MKMYQPYLISQILEKLGFKTKTKKKITRWPEKTTKRRIRERS